VLLIKPCCDVSGDIASKHQYRLSLTRILPNTLHLQYLPFNNVILIRVKYLTNIFVGFLILVVSVKCKLISFVRIKTSSAGSLTLADLWFIETLCDLINRRKHTLLYFWNFLSFCTYVFFYQYSYLRHEGTRWRSWFRHCATSREDTGSFTYGVVGIFYLFIPSSPNIALGTTHLLTDVNTVDIYCG
jgi:hypothetical protein